LTHIHFSVCGLGLGHASRCAPIIRESLRRGYGVSISTYGDAVEYFRRLGLSVNTVPAVDYGRGPMGEVSLKATLIKNIFLPLKVSLQTLIESQLIEDADADVVLSDTRVSAILASRILRIPNLLLLNQYKVVLEKDRWLGIASISEDFINAFTIAWSLSDRLIIADYPPPLTISKENLQMREKDRRRAQLVGPIMEKQPHQYPSREKLKEALGFDPSNQLITIMPTGPAPDRARFIKLMLPLLPALKQYQVFMTGVNRAKVDFAVPRNVRLVEWVDDEYGLLASSDIVITRAGHTLSAKALAFGCRLVLTPIPRQTEQESNARSLAEKKAAVILKEKEVDAENLLQAIKNASTEIDWGVIKKYQEFANMVNSVGVILEELIRPPS